MVKCDFEGCDREFKGQGPLNLHKRGAHRPPTTVKAPAEVKAAPVSEMVTFTSPKLGLTVIVSPEYWDDKKVGVNMQGEDIFRRTKVEGKIAQFEGGVFRTKDPEIIDFLENKYNEPRFPVFSSRVTKTWVK